MNQLMNSWLTMVNSIGGAFWNYAASMFVQSGILIALLLIVDFLLRKRVRATFRYWVWMLVFVKLLLPPTLSVPTGIGYWFSERLTADSVISEELSTGTPLQSAALPTPEPLVESVEIPLSHVDLEPAIPAAPVVSYVVALTWQGTVFLVWLAGISAFSVLLIRRINFVRRLIARSSPADDHLLAMLDRCRHELGITRNVQLRLSGGTPSPAACGLLKPTILMPRPFPTSCRRKKTERS